MCDREFNGLNTVMFSSSPPCTFEELGHKGQQIMGKARSCKRPSGVREKGKERLERPGTTSIREEKQLKPSGIPLQ